jgi:hypothetical protein
VATAWALDANDDLYVLEIRRGRWKTHDIVSNMADLVVNHKIEVYAGEQGQLHQAIWPLIEAELKNADTTSRWTTRSFPFKISQPERGRCRDGSNGTSYISLTTTGCVRRSSTSQSARCCSSPTGFMTTSSTRWPGALASLRTFPSDFEGSAEEAGLGTKTPIAQKRVEPHGGLTHERRVDCARQYEQYRYCYDNGHVQWLKPGRSRLRVCGAAALGSDTRRGLKAKAAPR